ncbi:hypothetical protein [Flavobacterium capsici]|uniref:Lipoprotein n=1 Tax=Flavobacterium capsici TaxID=3075618 RepID=A0AA96EYW7_9FLAO|nr:MULTISPECIES: hypothetical protein [unclassified Flavobacterium]WNM19303.1 hypothetical protein RN608_01150 [Flavobacterium sp. PMR2A8]WNM20692.1 hypothetical protein RN605_08320 [Flavobacterium sp. PMTSA4]
MNKKFILVLIIFIVSIFSCEKNKTNNSIKSKKEFKSKSDSIKYLNYINLIELGNGTIDRYIVVNVKNLNTGEKKEICTYSGFLDYALEVENKNDKIQQQIRNKERYFEFKDTAALNNIGFYSYSIDELKDYEKKINFDSILVKLSKKEYTGMEFGKNHNELNMFAHLLFNKGILSQHYSCYCMFQIIDENYINDRKKEIKRFEKE